MTCDIFIKTCAHDAEYHRHCLASIDKFCTGFRRVVEVIREDPSPKIGYLAQQVDKMEADLHTDADFILITDSDTIMIEPVTPESFMTEGKPHWLMTPWTPEMLAHPGTRAWFECMKNFNGEVPPGEFMRRQPFMFPRHVLPSIREHCLKRFGVPLREFVMNQKSFSEWNTLGFHCWLNHRDDFHWIITSTDELPPLRVLQMWSHTPITENLERINQILA